jgi:hypothetical protein
MSRKLVTVISIVVLASMVLSSSAMAQSLPGTGWWSGTQVQNVGSSQATVQVLLYDSASTAQFPSSDILIDPGAATTFTPNSFAGLTAGFQGSGIVSSNQPVKAITNVTNQLSGGLGTTGGKAAAQYQGTEATATTIYFPLTKNNRFGETTAYYIQNAGTSAATAQVVFKMDNGSVFTHTTPPIGVGQMVVVVPDDAGVPDTPSNATRVNVGSATVTSAQPLAGTVLEYREGENPATVLKGTRALTGADFDSKAFAPVAKNNRFGRFTGIQVLNVSGSPINVTIDYVGSAANNPACLNQTFQDTATGIAPGTSKTFVNLTGQSNLAANCTAAATISATGNFVAIVNESNMTGGTAAGTAYFALPNNSKTTKVSAPLFKDRRFSFSTGLQIQNVGSATATNVVATFVCKGNNGSNTPFTAISNPRTIPAGGAYLFIKPSTMPAGTFTGGNPFSLQGANCGVTVTGDQPLVSILNESPDTAGALDDNNYEGFNLAP